MNSVCVVFILTYKDVILLHLYVGNFTSCVYKKKIKGKMLVVVFFV